MRNPPQPGHTKCPSSSSQIHSLAARLAASERTNAALAQENSQLRRSSPLRPGAPAAIAAARIPAPTPTPTPAVRTYVVADGDTLSRIALRFYGSSSRWPDIYDANRSALPSPGALSVGQTLRIP